MNYHFVENPWVLWIRPGHIVIFHLPATGPNSDPHLEIGMILSVWKGIKAPKLCAGECHVNSCTAFRAVSLDIVDEEARQAQGPLWIRRNKYARGTLGAGFGYAFLHTPCVDERNDVSGQRRDSLLRLRPNWRQKDKFTPWCKACLLQQSLLKEMATRKETSLMMVVVVVVVKILSSSAFHVFLLFRWYQLIILYPWNLRITQLERQTVFHPTPVLASKC